ncbi:hypothetical protein LY76DRAFT_365704 [Colletotrichum caudatum]|nr:hypothetical protein LY76DRAFT_365704 [Colletotrichum caudatum]
MCLWYKSSQCPNSAFCLVPSPLTLKPPIAARKVSERCIWPMFSLVETASLPVSCETPSETELRCLGRRPCGSRGRPALPGQDESLGPWAGDDCRGGFDLALLFEEAVLAVPLQSLLLLVLPICALRLARSDAKVVAGTLRHLKASASICLFLSTLLDTARARTLWMSGSDRTIPAFFTCTLVLRAVMGLFDSTEKRHILVPRHKEYSKEVTSGTFNRSVFLWLTSLFVKGYRNILRLDDLYPLDPELASWHIYRKLADAWDKGKTNQCGMYQL